MNAVSKFSVKATGIVLGFPLAFVFVFIDDILSAWVGPQFLFLSPVIMLMIAFMVGIQSIVPAYTLTMAYKSMRVPATLSILFGLLNIGLIIVFYVTTELGLLGVALAWTASMFLRNCVFMPWYIAKATDVPIRSYFIPLIYGYLYFIISATVCFAIDHIFGLKLSILGLVAAFIILFSIYMLILIPTLKENEKSVLLSTLPNTISSSKLAERLFK